MRKCLWALSAGTADGLRAENETTAELERNRDGAVRAEDSPSANMNDLVKYGLAFILPVLFVFYRNYASSSSPRTTTQTTQEPQKPVKSVMQPPRSDLAPPKDDPFTTEELKAFDGSDPQKPIYVAIKGTVFDVSHKRDVYGPSGSYKIFAGKDGSKGLGMSSLKPEDAVPDYSDLDEKDRKVLDDWHGFFSKRYNIVGKVIDGPLPPVDIPNPSAAM